MRAIATRAAAAGGGGGDGGGGGRRGRRGESVGANVGEACTLAVATQQIPKKKKTNPRWTRTPVATQSSACTDHFDSSTFAWYDKLSDKYQGS